MESTNREIIYQGNSVISVEILPDYSIPVVIKTPAKRHPSRRSLRTLENEYQMTRALNAVKGVRKALGKTTIENQPALILEYIEGETLGDYIVKKELDLRSRLEIAVDLTRILREIHQQHVIHLDLNSKNILIGKDQEAVHIIDLGSASHIDRGGYHKVRPDQLLGTLPYISPEQTGRINRAVDERSDLYSLGVVIYELMSGQLPFDSKDPMELVHHHIARVPVSPSEVSSEIPEVLSAIILKLLSKNAKDRYQSAAGVQADLEKCLLRLSPEDTIEEFPLGEADYAGLLRYPQKLYGRGDELKELESAFESACRETSSMMFVSGYSGIGKTILVEDIQPVVSNYGGYFIRGKFDQFLRTTPYSAITSAFTEFVYQILAEPESAFNRWQDKVQSALGGLGQVMTDMIPALENLIGPQPDVPELGGQEAENRFNFVFINFILTVATEEHPLVLFIDDLQWIDAASLRLLEVIQSDFNQSGLLVIGAYRDNEVDASHPLMGILDHQEGTGLPIRILKLDDLHPQDVEALLSDMLRSRESVKELGTIVYDKTHGNPFFMRRLLFSLNEEGRILYDAEIKSWKWDIEEIKAEAVADNVADLLAESIAQLPEESVDILKLAACIGNRFDISTLAMISSLEERDVIKLLNSPISGQYIFKLSDGYEFVHDQVQQASYALVAEDDRPRVHLEIGRTLFSLTTGDELEEALFDIVHHFNAGAPLLESESEKVTVAELDLKAARKARNAAAYAAGFAYVMQGLALLNADSWQHHYDLTLALHNEAAELSYLTGQFDRLDEIEERIYKNTRSILDRTYVFYLRTMIDTDQGRLLESIETGIGTLEELGITIPREPSPEDIQRAETTFTEALTNWSMEELAHLPVMTDRGALAAMEIMAAVLLNAYIASPPHLSLLTYRGASLSLQKGNGPWSPFFFSVVVLLWAGEVDNSPTDASAKALEEAQKLAEILLKMLENPKYARCKAKSLDAILGPLNWSGSMKQLLDLALEIYQTGLDTGDLVYAGMGVFHLANYGVASGMNLNEYIKTVSAYRQHVIELGQDYTYRMAGIGLQTAENLMTPCSEPDVLEEQHFDERQWLPDAVAANDGLTLFLVFQAKLLLSYHFDRDGRLIECAGEAEKYLESVHGMINIGFFRFYDSLSRLRLYGGLSADERDLALKRVENNQLRMHIWARIGPTRYQHKYDLVEAEMARVSSNIGLAIENYERAIEGARDNEFIHEEALANELYARFWQERGNDRIAEMYMREACTLYHQWGADAKVSHLEERYSQWFKAKTILTGKPDTPAGIDKVKSTITQSTTPIQLDLESITRASQFLSAETDLEQLLTRMITLVMANSGAEKAVLLLKQEDEWFVQARKDITTDEPTALFHRPFDPTDRETALIPESVFNYCQRMKDVLVLGDAQLDHRFDEDWMIQKYNIQSIACLPALSQGQLRAMLYLENTQMADVFTLENLEILKHLSAQFAVSVENATLYDSLNQLVEERTFDLQKKIVENKRTEEHLQQEVAERKTAERELQSQIILFDSMLDTTVDTIEIFDPDTLVYIKWNKACTEVTGYSDEEFATMNPATSFFDEADAQRIEAVIDEVIREGYAIVTADIIAKDGTRTPMEFLGSMARDAEGNPLYFISIGRDITERKKAEEALRASEEKYRDLVEKVSDVIYSINADGVITYLNPAIESLIGLPPEHIVGQRFVQFIHPEDLGRLQDNTQTLFSGGNPGSPEYRVLTSSGETRWIRITSQPIMKEDQVNGIQGVLRDITERKIVEEQLEDMATAAERQRLARELHDSVTQSLYSLDLFANATQEALSKGKIETVAENTQQVRNLSQQALADMRLLIFELRPPVLDEVGLAGALHMRLESVERRSGLKTTLDVKGDEKLDRSFETELYAIAVEALNNCLKHAQAQQVTVILENNNQHCCLTISDDGIGFDPQIAENTGGFGLKNMRERSRNLGCKISLETSPGEGTTIRVEVSK